MEGVTNLVDGVLSVCNLKLQKELQKHNVDHSILSLDDIFQGDPFAGIKTSYKQKQFIRNKLPFVVRVVHV